MSPPINRKLELFDTKNFLNSSGQEIAAYSSDVGHNDRQLSIHQAAAKNHDSFLMGSLGPEVLSPDNEQLQKIFTDAFAATNLQVNAALSEHDTEGTGYDKESGTTSLVCWVQKNHIVVANAGDCEAKLVYKNAQSIYEIKVLTKPHRLSNSDEKIRVENNQHGDIIENKPQRLCSLDSKRGGLVPTRGLGATNYAPGFTHEPEIIIEESTNLKDAYLITSSDGVWESLNNDEILDIFNNAKYEMYSLSKKTHELIDKSISNGSKDNVTLGICKIVPNLVVGVFDGLGTFGGVAARVAAEKMQVNIFRSLIANALVVKDSKHKKIDQQLKKLAAKLTSEQPKVNPMSWTKATQLAQGTQAMLNVVLGEYDHTEKMSAVQQYHDNYVTAPWWREYSYMLTVIACAAVGAIVGALLGALLTGPFFVGGAVLGALEGAAEGAAFVAAAGTGISFTNCGLHFSYRCVAIESTAIAAISDARHYPKFCS
ncbi:MAG: PP2C family protein-serine/threonine phosphatase [Legionellales bacterium]|jgi:serine/threonine protein phosphatase PrpC